MPVDRQAVIELLKERESPDEATRYGNERVDIELVGGGNGPYRARKRNFEFLVDEPAMRGGEDSAPNPLGYFLAGAATCLLSQFALCSIADDVEISSLKLTARMRINRSIAGGSVLRIVYDVSLEADASDETLIRMAEKAQDMCYAHNTLAKAGVELITQVRRGEDTLVTLRRNSSDDPSGPQPDIMESAQ